jgi:hypothetical protein
MIGIANNAKEAVPMILLLLHVKFDDDAASTTMMTQMTVKNCSVGEEEMK